MANAAAFGTHERLRGQLRIALHNGVSKDEIVERAEPDSGGDDFSGPGVWICSRETGWPEEPRNPMATGWSWLSQGDRRLQPRLMAVLMVCATSSTAGVADGPGLRG